MADAVYTFGRKAVLVLLAALMALGVALSPLSTGAAYAGFPCGWPNDPPNDHYHREYVVNTKHDYQYTYGSAQGDVIRVWWIKKDRDGDGDYRYYDTYYDNCGKYA